MGNKFKPEVLGVPSKAEFMINFNSLYENRSNVAQVWVEKHDLHHYLCVDLDGVANFWGHKDFKMRLKREQAHTIRELVNQLWQKVKEGIAPSKPTLVQIYNALYVAP